MCAVRDRVPHAPITSVRLQPVHDVLLRTTTSIASRKFCITWWQFAVSIHRCGRLYAPDNAYSRHILAPRVGALGDDLGVMPSPAHRAGSVGICSLTNDCRYAHVARTNICVVKCTVCKRWTALTALQLYAIPVAVLPGQLGRLSIPPVLRAAVTVSSACRFRAAVPLPLAGLLELQLGRQLAVSAPVHIRRSDHERFYAGASRDSG